MRRLLIRHLVVCVAGAIAVMVGLVAVGWTPRVDFFVAGALSAAVASLALRVVGQSVVPLVWPSLRPPAPTEIGADSRVTFLEHSLRRSGEDETAFALRVRPVLSMVATHRLRRVGVDLDDEQARALLGDEAWELLTSRGDRLARRRQLVRVIDRLEHL